MIRAFTSLPPGPLFSAPGECSLLVGDDGVVGRRIGTLLTGMLGIDVCVKSGSAECSLASDLLLADSFSLLELLSVVNGVLASGLSVYSKVIDDEGDLAFGI